MAEDGSSLTPEQQEEFNKHVTNNADVSEEPVAPSKSAENINKEFSNAAQKRQKNINAAVLTNTRNNTQKNALRMKMKALKNGTAKSPSRTPVSPVNKRKLTVLTGYKSKGLNNSQRSNVKRAEMTLASAKNNLIDSKEKILKEEKENNKRLEIVQKEVDDLKEKVRAGEAISAPLEAKAKKTKAPKDKKAAQEAADALVPLRKELKEAEKVLEEVSKPVDTKPVTKATKAVDDAEKRLASAKGVLNRKVASRTNRLEEAAEEKLEETAATEAANYVKKNISRRVRNTVAEKKAAVAEKAEAAAARTASNAEAAAAHVAEKEAAHESVKEKTEDEVKADILAKEGDLSGLHAKVKAAENAYANTNFESPAARKTLEDARKAVKTAQAELDVLELALKHIEDVKNDTVKTLEKAIQSLVDSGEDTENPAAEKEIKNLTKTITGEGSSLGGVKTALESVQTTVADAVPAAAAAAAAGGGRTQRGGVGGILSVLRAAVNAVRGAPAASALASVNPVAAPAASAAPAAPAASAAPAAKRNLENLTLQDTRMDALKTDCYVGKNKKDEYLLIKLLNDDECYKVKVNEIKENKDISVRSNPNLFFRSNEYQLSMLKRTIFKFDTLLSNNNGKIESISDIYRIVINNLTTDPNSPYFRDVKKESLFDAIKRLIGNPPTGISLTDHNKALLQAIEDATVGDDDHTLREDQKTLLKEGIDKGIKALERSIADAKAIKDLQTKNENTRVVREQIRKLDALNKEMIIYINELRGRLENIKTEDENNALLNDISQKGYDKKFLDINTEYNKHKEKVEESDFKSYERQNTKYNTNITDINKIKEIANNAVELNEIITQIDTLITELNDAKDKPAIESIDRKYSQLVSLPYQDLKDLTTEQKELYTTKQTDYDNLYINVDQKVTIAAQALAEAAAQADAARLAAEAAAQADAARLAAEAATAAAAEAAAEAARKAAAPPEPLPAPPVPVVIAAPVPPSPEIPDPLPLPPSPPLTPLPEPLPAPPVTKLSFRNEMNRVGLGLSPKSIRQNFSTQMKLVRKGLANEYSEFKARIPRLFPKTITPLPKPLPAPPVIASVISPLAVAKLPSPLPAPPVIGSKSKTPATKYASVKLGRIDPRSLPTRITICGETVELGKKTLLTKGGARGRAVFDLSPEMLAEEKEVVPLEQILLADGFEKLYLGWLNAKDPKYAERVSAMKVLFRLVFSDKVIDKNTNKIYDKLQKMYVKASGAPNTYTGWRPEDKIPCNGSELWSDFNRSIEYRMKTIEEDIRNIKLLTAAEPGKYTLYQQAKADQYDELDRLHESLQDKTGCYDYDNEEGRIPVAAVDPDTARMLRIIKELIDKKPVGGDAELAAFEADLKGEGNEAKSKKELWTELTELIRLLSAGDEVFAKAVFDGKAPGKTRAQTLAEIAAMKTRLAACEKELPLVNDMLDALENMGDPGALDTLITSIDTYIKEKKPSGRLATLATKLLAVLNGVKPEDPAQAAELARVTAALADCEKAGVAAVAARNAAVAAVAAAEKARNTATRDAAGATAAARAAEERAVAAEKAAAAAEAEKDAAVAEKDAAVAAVAAAAAAQAVAEDRANAADEARAEAAAEAAAAEAARSAAVPGADAAAAAEAARTAALLQAAEEAAAQARTDAAAAQRNTNLKDVALKAALQRESQAKDRAAAAEAAQAEAVRGQVASEAARVAAVAAQAAAVSDKDNAVAARAAAEAARDAAVAAQAAAEAARAAAVSEKNEAEVARAVAVREKGAVEAAQAANVAAAEGRVAAAEAAAAQAAAGRGASAAEAEAARAAAAEELAAAQADAAAARAEQEATVIEANQITRAAADRVTAAEAAAAAAVAAAAAARAEADAAEAKRADLERSIPEQIAILDRRSAERAAAAAEDKRAAIQSITAVERAKVATAEADAAAARAEAERVAGEADALRVRLEPAERAGTEARAKIALAEASAASAKSAEQRAKHDAEDAKAELERERNTLTAELQGLRSQLAEKESSNREKNAALAAAKAKIAELGAVAATEEENVKGIWADIKERWGKSLILKHSELAQDTPFERAKIDADEIIHKLDIKHQEGLDNIKGVLIKLFESPNIKTPADKKDAKGAITEINTIYSAAASAAGAAGAARAAGAAPSAAARAAGAAPSAAARAAAEADPLFQRRRGVGAASALVPAPEDVLVLEEAEPAQPEAPAPPRDLADEILHRKKVRQFGSRFIDGPPKRGGGRSAPIPAQTVLILLALSCPDETSKVLLEKSSAVINDLGSCEESLEVLRSLLDLTDTLPEVDEEILEFREVKSVDPASVAALATAYNAHFTTEEKATIEAMFGKKSVYAKPPAEYSEILGNSPYALNSTKGTVLKGVDDMDEDPTLTEEELSAIAPVQGRLSEGALTLLYLAALHECGS